MSRSIRPYDTYFKAGVEALRRNQLTRAIRQFEMARETCGDMESRPELEYQCGIAYRELGCYRSANEAFHSAYRDTRDTLIRGEILREWGKLLLEQGEIRQALNKFHGSCLFLENGNRTELAFSLSFLGRALFLAQNDLDQAQAFLYDAHQRLHRENDEYELDNLMWLLRMKLRPEERRRLRRRAYRLALRTRDGRRLRTLCMTICNK